MPANYAHYRFGKQVLPELPAHVRQSIQRFRRLYDMGLHGPDIFFYYNPFLTTAVGDLGSKFHAQTGQEFFTHACAQAKTEADRAYLYGLLGHYCLDSACHPYVQKQVDSGDARHVELESEFDRHLLEKDGLVPPHTQDMSRHMKLTRGECVTVAGFYPPATPGNVHSCMRNMILAVRFLAGTKRKTLEALMKKMPPVVADQLMPTAPNQHCTHLNKGMQAYYDRALARYPVLLEQLTAHMTTGEPLGEDFAADFG